MSLSTLRRVKVKTFHKVLEVVEGVSCHQYYFDFEVYFEVSK